MIPWLISRTIVVRILSVVFSALAPINVPPLTSQGTGKPLLTEWPWLALNPITVSVTKFSESCLLLVFELLNYLFHAISLHIQFCVIICLVQFFLELMKKKKKVSFFFVKIFVVNILDCVIAKSQFLDTNGILFCIDKNWIERNEFWNCWSI